MHKNGIAVFRTPVQLVNVWSSAMNLKSPFRSEAGMPNSRTYLKLALNEFDVRSPPFLFPFRSIRFDLICFTQQDMQVDLAVYV